MRRKNTILVKRIEQDRWRLLEDAERIGIENTRLPESKEPKGVASG
jgi:hypothetical protein